MKQLQCNFTTIEQSKRLLELGIPKCTADCVYIIYQKDNNEDYCTLNVPLPHQSPITDVVEKGNADYKDGNVKFCYCWSVGRLIEILKECILYKSELEEIFEYLKDCVFTVDTLFQIYKEWGDLIDFSKLEE